MERLLKIYSHCTLIRNSERTKCLLNHSDNANTCVMKIARFLW